MIINLSSISFNTDISSSGGTPSWGTEMGQGEGYKFSFDNCEEFITALVYNRVDESKVYCPLGKGGNRGSDYEFVMASLFKKVFVNGKRVNDSSFLLLIVKKIVGNNHVGRRTLKYNPSMTFEGVNYNEPCFENMTKVLGLNSNSAWFVHEINVKNQDELHFTAYIINAEQGETYKDSNDRKNRYLECINQNGISYFINKKHQQNVPVDNIQQIFYGAPGTGKSHTVKTETEAWEKQGRVVRTTFHPDSDYSTFVGAYKPTTESVQRYDIYNKPMTRDGAPVMEQIITYEFVEQAFLQAYIDAWTNRDEPEFLIIEEINRGNCAQIFGDLFQLLDRGDNGYSDYAIRADKDLQKHLCTAFEDVEIADYPNVKTGKELLLPGNLYIRATMNTSDQSLFPIDSAFKRRWDWKYVPIAKGNENGTELNWMIEVDGDLYDWWTFVTTINKHVFDTTNSEDKQLGFFFCKAKANIISAETFVCKVIFYLWNDVFKDFGFDDKIFEDNEDNENPKLSFDKFYLANGEVNEGKVRMFLDNLGMMPKESTEGNSNIVDPKTKIEVNGRTVRFINAIPYMAVEEYVHLNPGKTAQEVVGVWDQFKNCSMRTWIVCNKQDHDAMKPQYANYSHEIKCADGQSLWVNKDGWMHHPQNPNRRDTIAEFIKAVNDAELGVAITETTL